MIATCKSTPGTIHYCVHIVYFTMHLENRYENDASMLLNQSCCLRPVELPGTCGGNVKACHFMVTVVFVLFGVASLA